MRTHILIALLWAYTAWAVGAEPANSLNLCSKTQQTRVLLVDPAVTEAAKSGDLNALRGAFKAGVPANGTTNEGFSLLHLAITEHQDAVIDLLIRQGADVNQPFMGSSPLALARISSGGSPADLKREQTLIKAGAKPSDFDIASEATRKLGFRSLAQGFIDAIKKGDMGRLELYARATYDINRPFNNDGISYLHVAAIEGTPEAVRYLVQCGANVNARTKKGAPILWFARERPEIVELLRGLGATEKD